MYLYFPFFQFIPLNGIIVSFSPLQFWWIVPTFYNRVLYEEKVSRNFLKVRNWLDFFDVWRKATWQILFKVRKAGWRITWVTGTGQRSTSSSSTTTPGSSRPALKPAGTRRTSWTSPWLQIPVRKWFIKPTGSFYRPAALIFRRYIILFKNSAKSHTCRFRTRIFGSKHEKGRQNL